MNKFKFWKKILNNERENQVPIAIMIKRSEMSNFWTNFIFYFHITELTSKSVGPK